MCVVDLIFDFIFSKEMAHDVVGGFVGFAIGVFWANWQLNKDRAEQSKLLRRNLIKAFRSDLDGIGKYLEFLQTKPHPIIPNFRLDTSTVGHILFTGRNLFEDDTWFDRFNWQRFQLEHINTKLDYFQLNLLPKNESQTALAQQQLASLVTHLLTTQKELSELIVDYEKIHCE